MFPEIWVMQPYFSGDNFRMARENMLKKRQQMIELGVDEDNLPVEYKFANIR